MTGMRPEGTAPEPRGPHHTARAGPVLRVPSATMGRPRTADKAENAPARSAAEPPWPVVPDEPIVAPDQQRRAWRSISYEQRYLEQREAFLRIARELANTSSPDAVQISHIVAQAGVSRRTFYEHFATKEACFAEVMRRSAQPIIATFVEAAEKALPYGPTETFHAVLSSWAELISGDHPRFSRQLAFRMWTEGLRPGGEFSEALNLLVGVVTDVVVVAAQRLGTPLEEPLLHLAARQQVMGLFGSVLQLLDHGSPAAEQKMMANVIAVGLGFPAESFAARIAPPAARGRR